MSSDMTSSNVSSAENYRLNIPPEVQLIYTLGFVGGSLELVLYGLVVALFIQCFKSAIRNAQRWDASQKRSRIVQLVYICSVFTASTLFIAADTWSNIISTLEYPLYPGGPVGWIIEHYNHPVIVLGNVSFLLIAWLSDGFMMYRLYIVYSQSGAHFWIMALPGLLFLASIATGILLLSQTSLPHSSLFSQINFGLANFSIMAALHLLLTGLISARLMLHRVRMQRVMGSDTRSLRMYTSLTTILVESSALYSAFALMFIIPFGMDHPSSRFFLPLVAQVQVISPLLVAYRLTKETAWTSTTSQTLTNVPGAGGFGHKDNEKGTHGEVTMTGAEVTNALGSEKVASETTLKV